MPTFPDTHRDLLDAPIATLATIAPDGKPQVSAVWFLIDDEGVHISLNTARYKVKNMTERPVATLFILDLENPARYLEIRGDVTMEPDPDYEFADVLCAKYGGADLRGRDLPGESRLKVTIEPTRIYAADLSA